MNNATADNDQQTGDQQTGNDPLGRGESPQHGSGRAQGGREAQPHRSRLYHNLVPAYQALWPAIAGRRIARSVASLEIPAGAQVLEVGVGTGLSLENYPKHAQITGVDLSESMLAEAKTLIEQRHWDHVTVMPMNAEKLEFPDDSFDYVTSFHTISVVTDPQAMMNEMVRVCRPGGKILVVNHFRSDNPLVASLVDSASPVTRKLGWRTDLDLDQIVHGLPLRLDACAKTHPFSLFTVVQATCKPERAGDDARSQLQ